MMLRLQVAHVRWMPEAGISPRLRRYWPLALLGSVCCPISVVEDRYVRLLPLLLLDNMFLGLVDGHAGVGCAVTAHSMSGA